MSTDNKDSCMICGKEVERLDLEYVELGKHFPPHAQIERVNPQTGEREKYSLYRSFYSCAECTIKEKLQWYKLNYELVKENIETLREENNLFRTLMTKVETMQAIGEKGDTVSIRSYIVQHRPGWEALSIDTLLLFLDLYQKHASVFSEILNKKASKEEIKKQLEKKTEKAKAEGQVSPKELAERKARISASDGLKNQYDKDTAKAIKSLMKTLKCSEEVAHSHIQSTLRLAQARTEN